jgi:hypothetical protein
MQIDERFLTVHPATAAWWERRSSCESCRHLKLREGHEGEGVMRCTAVRVDQRASRDLLGAYCIDVIKNIHHSIDEMVAASLAAIHAVRSKE